MGALSKDDWLQRSTAEAIAAARRSCSATRR